MTWTQAIRVQARSRRAGREVSSTRWWQLALLVLVIAVWWLIAHFELLSPNLVPNPFAVVRDLAVLVPTNEYWSAVGATLLGALVGLIAAILIGIPIGLITGSFSRAELSARFLVDFGRSFPSVALVGVVVLMLGRGVEMKAVLVFAAVVFPIIVQTQYGVAQVQPMIRETCDAFRIPKSLYVRRVLLPSAAPSVMTGLRLAASVAVLVAIGAEVLTSASGIGQKITEAQLGSNAPKAFAFIVTAGVLGWLVNWIVGLIQAQVVRWRPSGAGEE